MRRLVRPAVRRPIYYHRAYRLPLPEAEASTAFEPRRADYVRWFLLSEHLARANTFLEPPRASFEDLALVHTPEYLESLSSPERLAEIFAVSPRSIPVDAVLETNRLAVGGTIAAARTALADSAPVINLLGGFHHAGPAHGAGFCTFNDVAVAIAVARRDGFAGSIAVLDLDAHQPDGTSRCLAALPGVWMGSISASIFDGLAGVDEIALPGATDAEYLAALDGLLARMPSAGLNFVIAGGDTLAGDQFGHMRMTLAGARTRDDRVRDAVAGHASVWLPAGGYSRQAWRVLAGTVLSIFRVAEDVPDIAPLSRRFADVAQRISGDALTTSHDFDADDLDALLGGTRPVGDPSFLGFYSANGLEHALFRYGVLEILGRMGYRDFRVTITSSGVGQQATLLGTHARAPEQALIELAAEKKEIAGKTFLYIHWLSLRHPAGEFSDRRPKLPGQEVPGLGIAAEMSELIERIAVRLTLAGVAFRPSSFHVAYASRHRFRFEDTAREARFRALLRDLAMTPVRDATRLVADGRLRLEGAPYVWEADLMISKTTAGDADAAELERLAASTRFSVSDA